MTLSHGMRYGLLLCKGLLGNSVLGNKIRVKKKWLVLCVLLRGWLFCTWEHCDADHWHTEEKSNPLSCFSSLANQHTAVLWHLCRRNRQAKCSSSHDGSLFCVQEFFCCYSTEPEVPFQLKCVFPLVPPLLVPGVLWCTNAVSLLPPLLSWPPLVCCLLLFRDCGRILKLTLSITH